MTEIFLGYEVGSAKPISLPLHHLIITGMTRLSGKTTTLEALVSRSGLKAITFRTKRGEIGFEDAHSLPLFFDEKGLTHWKALEGLIEATLEEKVRREPGVRAQIIRVCDGAESLSDIYSRVEEKAEDPKIRGFVKDVLVKLKAYLDIVMPQIKRIDLVDALELREGANVMDLEGLTDEMQNLILQGVIRRIYEKERNTVIVMPEAWKFIPQDRGSPCKPIVEKFIREGAAIGNYLWIDSQDLRGVDKKFTRQIDNWILGRQRDEREVDATLKALPLPKKSKPKEEEIMTLDLGHFIACLHNDVYRIYVQPKWLPDEPARKVALGELSVEKVLEAIPVLEVDDPYWKERYEKEVPKLKEKIKTLERRIEGFDQGARDLERRVNELEGHTKHWKEQYFTVKKSYDEALKTIGDLNREVDALENELEQFRAARKALRVFIGAESIAGAVDYKKLAKEVAPLLQGLGAVTYTLEVREFVLRENIKREVDRILEGIRGLNDKQRGILREVMSVCSMSRTDLGERVTGHKRSSFRSGAFVGNWHKEYITPLEKLELVAFDSSAKLVRYTLPDKVKRMLEPYTQDAKEIEDAIAMIERSLVTVDTNA